jgi:hypothetical protein
MPNGAEAEAERWAPCQVRQRRQPIERAASVERWR